MEFRNLAEKDELSTEVGVSVNRDLTLVISFYNVRRGLNDDHPDYHLSQSNDMNDMVNVLEDEMKRRAHAYVLSFALQFPYCFKTLHSGT